jgi:hypothetical protein
MGAHDAPEYADFDAMGSCLEPAPMGECFRVRDSNTEAECLARLRRISVLRVTDG